MLSRPSIMNETFSFYLDIQDLTVKRFTRKQYFMVYSYFGKKFQLNYETVYQYHQLHDVTFCPSSPVILQRPH